jgi:hypothetical protein
MNWCILNCSHNFFFQLLKKSDTSYHLFHIKVAVQMRSFILRVNIKFSIANAWKNHENVFNIVGMRLFKYISSGKCSHIYTVAELMKLFCFYFECLFCKKKILHYACILVYKIALFNIISPSVYPKIKSIDIVYLYIICVDNK